MMTSQSIKEKKKKLLVLITNVKEEKRRTQEQIGEYKQKKIDLEKRITDSKNELKNIDTKLKQEYKCVICNKVCSSLVYYEKHLEIHQDRVQCNICLRYFYDQDELNHHLEASKNGMNGCRCPIKNIKGQQCTTILTSRQRYRNHCPHTRGFSIKYQ